MRLLEPRITTCCTCGPQHITHARELGTDSGPTRDSLPAQEAQDQRWAFPASLAAEAGASARSAPPSRASSFSASGRHGGTPAEALIRCFSRLSCALCSRRGLQSKAHMLVSRSAA